MKQEKWDQGTAQTSQLMYVSSLHRARLKPSIFLTIGIATHMVLMMVLGGKGTVSGPIVGAVVFVAINEFLVARLGSSELNIVAVGLLLVLVLLFFPKGIVGTLREYNRPLAILDWDLGGAVTEISMCLVLSSAASFCPPKQGGGL